MAKVYDKMTATGVFLRIPKDLQAYVYLPDYKAEMNTLYGIIAEYYNPAYGYAFPSIARLSLEYGKAERTTIAHLHILQKYELIDKRRTLMGNRYVPFYPLSRADLYEKYPEAQDARRKADERVDKERLRRPEYLPSSTFLP